LNGKCVNFLKTKTISNTSLTRTRRYNRYAAAHRRAAALRARRDGELAKRRAHEVLVERELREIDREADAKEAEREVKKRALRGKQSAEERLTVGGGVLLNI
jgi:hypothetical protein